jgi:GTP-binding nuclear protein Ran
MDSIPQTFKIAIIGAAGVGKTTYLTRLSTAKFRTSYIATFIPTSVSLTFKCKGVKGESNIVLDVSEYTRGAPIDTTNLKGGIVMFDVMDRKSYSDSGYYIRNFKSTGGDLPLVMCGNKVDCKDRVVGTRHIKDKIPCQYYDISVKSCYNFEKPWLYLIRKITGDETIEIVC